MAQGRFSEADVVETKSGAFSPDDVADAPKATGVQPKPVGEAFGRNAATRLGQNLNPMPILRGIGRIATNPLGPQAGLGEEVYEMGKSLVSPLANAPNAMRAFGRGEYGRGALTAAESLPIVGPIVSRAEESYNEDGAAGAAGSVVGDLATIPLTRGLGRVLSRGARAAAMPIVGTSSPAVAEAALANRAMPGLLRSGQSRATIRLNRVENEAASALKGPGGQAMIAPKDMRRGAATDAEWDRIKAIRGEPGAPQARSLQASAPSEVTTPTAQNVFGRARQSRDAGATGMAGAIDADQFSAVGQAVPEVAPMMSRANAIESVRDAYRGAPNVPISTQGLPNMQTRLVAGTINRLAGPTAQGAYSTGSALQSGLTRAALIAQMGRGGDRPAPMASHEPTTIEPARHSGGADHQPVLNELSPAQLQTQMQDLTRSLADPSLDPEVRAYLELQQRRVHEAMSHGK